MNRSISRWLAYYPVVLGRGELVPLYLKKYRQTQWLDEAQLSQMQLDSLRDIVSFALKSSDYYRRTLGEVGLTDAREISCVKDMRKLPTVSKEQLIHHRHEINVGGRLVFATKTTGGSTGNPVQIRKNPQALARERAATWRSYEWAGITIGDVQARFWGVPHTSQRRFLAHLADVASNRFRISAFDLNEETLTHYYHELERRNPDYLYGYVSAIAMLAAHIKERQLPPLPSLSAVVTTSEMLTEQARSRIAEAFKAPVFNEYGCGEVGSIAHECSAGKMHVMAENLLVETDEEGEVIVTDFFNLATPLVRYRVGDFAVLAKEKCECGRGLPVLEQVKGRAYDLVITPSGRVVHPETLIYVFEDLQARTGGAIKQFQVVQERIGSFSVKVVSGQGWSDSVEQLVIDGLKKCLGGGVAVEVGLCNRIPRERSGKMRVVKSLVGAQMTIGESSVSA